MRDQRLQGTALIFAEKKHYDEVKEQHEKNKAKREEQKQKRQANSKGVNESTPPSECQKVAADSVALVNTATTDGTNDHVLDDLIIELDEDSDSEDESDSDSNDLEPGTDGDGSEEQMATDDVLQDTSEQGAPTGDAVLPMPDEKVLKERRAVYLEAARGQKLTRKIQKGKASVKELGPELLDMVNAQKRKLMC